MSGKDTPPDPGAIKFKPLQKFLRELIGWTARRGISGAVGIPGAYRTADGGWHLPPISGLENRSTTYEHWQLRMEAPASPGLPARISFVPGDLMIAADHDVDSKLVITNATSIFPLPSAGEAAYIDIEVVEDSNNQIDSATLTIGDQFTDASPYDFEMDTGETPAIPVMTNFRILLYTFDDPATVTELAADPPQKLPGITRLAADLIAVRQMFPGPGAIVQRVIYAQPSGEPVASPCEVLAAVPAIGGYPGIPSAE